MKPAWAVAASVCLGIYVPAVMSATLDFETVPVGTKYGQDFGHVPGQVVLSQQGIDMSVENFFETAQNFTGFVRAEVGGQFDAAFPTTPLDYDSISTRFDLSGLGFNVNQASFEYVDFGIHYNFAVNAEPMYEVGSLSELPANVATGVTLALEELDAGTGRTRLTLTGNVDSFLVGGYELAIDTVIAIPEPTTLVLLAICGTMIVWRGSRRLTRSALSAS